MTVKKLTREKQDASMKKNKINLTLKSFAGFSLSLHFVHYFVSRVDLKFFQCHFERKTGDVLVFMKHITLKLRKRVLRGVEMVPEWLYIRLNQKYFLAKPTVFQNLLHSFAYNLVCLQFSPVNLFLLISKTELSILLFLKKTLRICFCNAHFLLWLYFTSFYDCLL